MRKVVSGGWEKALSATSSIPVAGDLRRLTGHELEDQIVLEHADPAARNTIDRPDEVVPHRGGDAAMTDRLTGCNVVEAVMERDSTGEGDCLMLVLFGAGVHRREPNVAPTDGARLPEPSPVHGEEEIWCLGLGA
jgi:hypothetical protein